ncbi:MAG TPA: DUF4430 domain-containing protein [Clostridiales bacterium]|jgi:hypothetical protein|nr:DUF4430 domain-containing protein [Clostridiales bacterium]
MKRATRILAILIALMVAALTPLSTVNFPAYGGTPEQEAAYSLGRAVAFYEKEQKWQLNNWEELAAISAAAGVPSIDIDLRQWDIWNEETPAVQTAPDADSYLSKYHSFVTTALISGKLREASGVQAVEQLAARAKADGSFAENDGSKAAADAQAYAMLALDGAIRNQVIPIAPNAYQGLQAARYLAGLQQTAEGDTKGGFSGAWDGGLFTVDATAIVAVALAPYIQDNGADATVAYIRPALERLVGFLEREQLPSGGFLFKWAGGPTWPGGKTESVNSTAYAIWGLSAIKGALVKTGPLTEVDLELKNRIDVVLANALSALLQWQNPDGSFRVIKDGAANFDSFATRQAMIALADISLDREYFNSLALRGLTLFPVEFSLITDKDVTTNFTTKMSAATGDKLSAVAALAWKKQGLEPNLFQSDAYHYSLNGNGQAVTEETVAVAGSGGSAQISLVANSVTREVVFQDSTMGVTLGEPVKVTLLEKTGGQPAAGVALTINGAYVGEDYDYTTGGMEPWKTDSQGQMTIPANKLLEAKDYVLSTKTDGVSRPTARLSVSQGAAETKTVSVRIEGIERNIAYAPELKMVSDGSKSLTAQDAIEKVLTDGGISHEITKGFINKIDGIPNSYFGGWDYWNFYHNGVSANSGIGETLLADQDQILLFYGDSTTVQPKLEPVYGNKLLKLTIKKSWYDYATSQMHQDEPVAGAQVTIEPAAGKKINATSNEQGVVTFSPLSPGTYRLQIEKASATVVKNQLALPELVRQAPDYGIKLDADGTVTLGAPFVVVGSGGSGGGQATQVTLKVIGYDGTKAVLFLPETSYVYQGGETALSLLKKAANLSVTEDGGYVSVIDGLKEKQYGAESGWKFSINGSYPAFGADSYMLKAGDRVVWSYVLSADATPDPAFPGEAPPAPVPTLEDLTIDSSYVATADETFEDISADDWFAPAVGYLAFHSLVNGRTPSLYAAADPVTRAEFITLLQRITGDRETTGEATEEDIFSDMKADDWYAKAVLWAAKRGLIKGYPVAGGVEFRPQAPISRQEMAVIMDRLQRQTVLQFWPKLKSDLQFTDESAIADYAQTAVRDLQQAGLISGIPNTGTKRDNSGGYRFEPAEATSRAQAAQILAAYHKAYRPVFLPPSQ